MPLRKHVTKDAKIRDFPPREIPPFGKSQRIVSIGLDTYLTPEKLIFRHFTLNTIIETTENA